MKGIRPLAAKSRAMLASEWDRLAEERHRQIVSGEDLSFEFVTVPATWRLFESADPALVLDIGSGTGDFTARLARVAGSVIALEPSRTCVALARRVCQTANNVRFVEASLEEAASELYGQPVTAAVAVMTLMTAPDLHGFARALAPVLRNGGKFVAIVTHPWFWPKYWGYESEPWFHYEIETFIEAPFTISKHRTEVRTTHIHRPLEHYLIAFAEAGFQLDELVEPIPSAEVQALYPVPWQFPRFLGLRWSKVA
jgi:SAM-dependent methyltransferase